MFERRVFEAGDTHWFTASFFHKYRHTHNSPVSVYLSTEKGWLVVLPSGRTGLDIVSCLMWADFQYQQGQSAFGCLYTYQQLFPLGALIWPAFPLTVLNSRMYSRLNLS
jgi:hypothetical protein